MACRDARYAEKLAPLSQPVGCSRRTSYPLAPDLTCWQIRFDFEFKRYTWDLISKPARTTARCAAQDRIKRLGAVLWKTMTGNVLFALASAGVRA